jgi:hypothetical protein
LSAGELTAVAPKSEERMKDGRAQRWFEAVRGRKPPEEWLVSEMV